MINTNIKNAQAEYMKFVLSSRHAQMKQILDTYIPYSEMKEILEKKRRDELIKKSERLRQDDKAKEKMDEELEYKSDEDEREDIKKKNEVEIQRILEEQKEKAKKREEDIKKKEYQILSMKMITEQEKEIFKTGIHYPETLQKLNKILQRNGDKPELTLHEKYKIQIPSYSFEDISSVKIPKAKFEVNIQYIKEKSFNPSFIEDSYAEDMQVDLNISQIKQSLYHKFKSENAKNGKFLSYSEEWIKPIQRSTLNQYAERERQDKIKRIIASISSHRIEDVFYEPLSQKIIIPVDENINEMYIFDPISINKSTGTLESNVSEVQLQKRARLLAPIRHDFFKPIINKLLKFLLIIKTLTEGGKKANIIEQFSGKSNNKTKLTEIKQTKIVTFSQVESFMKSKFGKIDMKAFEEEYKKRLKENEEKKKKKRLEQLKGKMKDALNQKEEKDYESDDVDEIELDRKQFNRRKDAIPIELLNDTKMLYGATYKPRKKMNYLDGLKMLIKEEVSKKHPK